MILQTKKTANYNPYFFKTPMGQKRCECGKVPAIHEFCEECWESHGKKESIKEANSRWDENKKRRHKQRNKFKDLLAMIRRPAYKPWGVKL